MTDPSALIATAGRATVGSLFRDRVASHPGRAAVQDGDKVLTYAQLNDRVNRTAATIAAQGLKPGERVALLAENCAEYLEIKLACAKLGVILACQNWRLAPAEVQHCLDLVEPTLVIVSPRHSSLLGQIDTHGLPVLSLGDDWEAALAKASNAEPGVEVDPEAGLVILYTSGTTGLPKGAVISHRAEVARAMLMHVDLPITPGDTCVAWPPLYHMGASDISLATLMTGGKVVVLDGFDLDAMLHLIEHERLAWLVLMPGMIDRLIEGIKARDIKPRYVGACGAMADLVPTHQLAEITSLLDAPFINTFGSTETGTPPCTTSLIPPGTIPDSLAKMRSNFVELRLLDEDGNDVPDGEPGEIALRGPTMFSGYWRNPEANAKDFRDGWFHMGDVFVRLPDGRYQFVDRAKYMIKSGGENIYPAEIERILLAHEQVADAAVVRRADDRWGEVPVAFIARKDKALAEDELYAACRQALAGFKQPKAIHFIAAETFPRSVTGKVQRHEMEAWLTSGKVPGEDR
ncbi:MAG: AMP-binding protein [Alphaproteobacteria bacterium]